MLAGAFVDTCYRGPEVMKIFIEFVGEEGPPKSVRARADIIKAMVYYARLIC